MDPWNAYHEATEEIKAFDEKHEDLRLAFISLGKALEAGGWGAVVSTDQTDPQNARLYGRADFEPVNLFPITQSTELLSDMIRRRHALVAQQQKAYKALPQSLRDRLEEVRRT